MTSKFGLAWATLALLFLGVAASGEPNEAIMKTVGISRTISSFGGPLRTTKIDANGVQVLMYPSAEFMIDLDYKGEPLTLVPSDFEMKDIETVQDGKELCTTLKLDCVKEGFPVVVSVLYHRDPLGSYLQKSIRVSTFKKGPDAIIRRVTIEDMVLKQDYAPMLPGAKSRVAYGDRSDFAAYDRKSGKGLFFFVTSPLGRESFSPRGLRMWEDTYVPLSQGCETGRATIGAVEGPPEIVLKRFRDFLWERYYVARGRSVALDWAPKPLDIRKAPLLAGEMKGEIASGNVAAAVLHGDEWSLALAGKSEAGFAAFSSCLDACRKMREGNPKAVIGVLPDPNLYAPYAHSGGSERLHWLGVVDRIGFPSELRWDSWQSLVTRQAFYDGAFLLPPATFSAAFGQAELAKKMPALTDKLMPYFEVYQHILSSPDGKSVDGEGHIIDNKGFLLLYNPSDQPQRIALPLDEPELELKGSLRLSDWTDAAIPASLGSAKLGDNIEVEIAPLAAKIIGVNVSP